MIPTLALSLVSVPLGMVLAQSAGPTQLVRQLALDAESAPLTAQVEQWPDEAREAFQQLLRQSVREPQPSVAADPLLAAERLAMAFASVWADEFLIRELGRFRSWTADERQMRVTADSLRIAGRDAYLEIGVDAALVLWQESLDISRQIADSAGIARALGNIGAVQFASGELDSAAVYYGNSYDIAVGQGDLRTAGNALTNLASVHVDRSELTSARELYAQAARVHERIGDQRGLAADLHNQGLLSLQLGDHRGAAGRFEQAMVVNERHGYPAGAGTNLLGLADVAWRAGEYARSDSLLHAADRAFHDGQDEAGIAATAHRRGLLEMQRGRYRQATQSMLDAAERFASLGWPIEASEALRDAATSSAATGELDRATELLDRAERLMGDRPEYLPTAAKLALTRGDLALRFNDPAEAMAHFRHAEASFAESADQAGRAEALQGQGHTRLVTREYSAAVDLLGRSLDLQEALGGAGSVASTRALLAYAEELAGDRAAARARLVRALDRLTGEANGYARAVTLLALGELELRADEPALAIEYLSQGLDLEAGGLSPSLAWRLHAGLGEAQRAIGDLEGSEMELAAAIDLIESSAVTVAADYRRAGYLRDKWDVYASLARSQLALGRVDEAFGTSERLRARQMLATLDRGRIAALSDADPGLLDREQDLRRHLDGLEARVELRRSDWSALRGGTEETERSLQLQLDRARTDYTRLLAEIESHDPEYADLVNPSLVTRADLSAALTPGEAFLEYLVTDQTTLAFVATRDSAIAIDLGIPGRSLSVLVDFARAQMQSTAGTHGSNEATGALVNLHRQLVAPIERTGALHGVRRLTIAPHRELHYLPFQALREHTESGPFLVERYEVRYVPSASVWMRLNSRPDPSGLGRALIIAPENDRLPGTRREAAELARRFGDEATFLVGSEATPSSLRALEGPYEVVHLATEGALNRANPMFSYLQLTSTETEDGRLEVHEVIGLDLPAGLVTLSACETGLGSGARADVPAGDDWLGFVRSFLESGASSVLATMWRVDDRATETLMAEFYRRLLAGMPASEALAITQRTLLGEPATRHPFYWAGFVLSGN